MASRAEILRDCVESNLLKAIANQKLLPAIKVMTDWLRLNGELVMTCVEVEHFMQIILLKFENDRHDVVKGGLGRKASACHCGSLCSIAEWFEFVFLACKNFLQFSSLYGKKKPFKW